MAEISTAYRDVLDGRRFAVLALHPTEATWSAYLPGSWPTPVWVDLGATFRETTDGESTDDSFVWLPDEQLEKLSNADVVLVVDTEQLPRMEANGLWTSLPAVTDGLALPNVKASATSSFLWGLDNLDDADGPQGRRRGQEPSGCRAVRARQTAPTEHFRRTFERQMNSR